MYRKNVFLWSNVIALGGFLFGFDTAVISGAEQSIQKYWSLNAFEHGFTVSIALIGTIIGSFLGVLAMNFIDRIGRRTLMLIGPVGSICTLALVANIFYAKDFNVWIITIYLIVYIAFSFPYLSERAGGGNTFLFFSVMMCLQFLFVWKVMPETKGKSLEQIGYSLQLL